MLRQQIYKGIADTVTHYWDKIGLTLTTTLTTPKGFVVFPALWLGITKLKDIQEVLWVLIILIVIDLITGILASYISKKKETNKSFFQIIFSEKTRIMTTAKLLMYTSTILMVKWIEILFQIKSFRLSFSNLDFDITMIVIFIWMLVEFVSITCENIPKMGFDWWSKIREIFQKAKEIKNNIDDLK